MDLNETANTELDKKTEEFSQTLEIFLQYFDQGEFPPRPQYIKLLENMETIEKLSQENKLYNNSTASDLADTIKENFGELPPLVGSIDMFSFDDLTKLREMSDDDFEVFLLGSLFGKFYPIDDFKSLGTYIYTNMVLKKYDKTVFLYDKVDFKHYGERFAGYNEYKLKYYNPETKMYELKIAKEYPNGEIKLSQAGSSSAPIDSVQSAKNASILGIGGILCIFIYIFSQTGISWITEGHWNL